MSCDVCDEEYRKIDGEYTRWQVIYINIEITECWNVFQVYIISQMFSEILRSLREQI